MVRTFGRTLEVRCKHHQPSTPGILWIREGAVHAWHGAVQEVNGFGNNAKTTGQNSPRKSVEMNESHFCGCDLYIHIKSLFEDGWTSCAKAKEEMLVLKDPSSTCER